MYWRMNAAKTAKELPTIRQIAGLDALKEAVGRATELGRPVHYSTGIGAIADEFGPQTIAGLTMLQYVSKLCAEYGSKIIATMKDPIVFPLAQEVVKAGFAEAGKADLYQEDMVRFLSSEQFAYAAGAMGTMQREQCAANIMIGAFYAEALLLAEAGFQAGAIQIGSTARMYQLPYFAIVCDYTLIAEEMFAASAYVSRDAEKLGALQGQDYAKVASVVVLIIGALLRTVGMNDLYNWLGIYGR